jgi:DNA-binding transcriptional MerR regulator
MTAKIGAIAERLGTTVRTLRFYEEQGLVHPHRSPRGTRLYDEEQEARFAALLALTRLGFSLEDLARLTGVRPASRTGDKASHAVEAQLNAMDKALKTQETAIAAQREDIRRAQAFLAGCHGCRRKPARAVCDRCEVSAGWQDIAILRVVWDEHQKG